MTGFPLASKVFAGSIDVLQLGIPVGRRCSFNALLVGFEGKAHLVSHPADSGLPDGMSLAREGFLQLAHRLARPPEQALWISFRIQHLFQIGSQGGVLGRALFPATTSLADALPWLIERSCLAGDVADPSSANALGLCRYIQPPLSLVEPALHQLVLSFV